MNVRKGSASELRSALLKSLAVTVENEPGSATPTTAIVLSGTT